MTGTVAEIVAARAEAAAARQRIDRNVALLRNRLDPRVRAREAWVGVRGKGEELGDDAVELAYERPGTIALSIGAVTLFLLRHPIARLVRWLTPRRSPKWDATKSNNPTASRPSARR